jgi:hypothetical protein
MHIPGPCEDFGRFGRKSVYSTPADKNALAVGAHCDAARVALGRIAAQHVARFRSRRYRVTKKVGLTRFVILPARIINNLVDRAPWWRSLCLIARLLGHLNFGQLAKHLFRGTT